MYLLLRLIVQLHTLLCARHIVSKVIVVQILPVLCVVTLLFTVTK